MSGRGSGALRVMMTLVALLSWACVGELSPVPECFQDGREQELTQGQLSLNLCCEPSGAGDLSCQEALVSLMSPVAPLAYCATSGVCEVCTLGVSCECITHQDCDALRQRCRVSDDPARCQERLDAPPSLSRCALCEPL